ncbi:MAG TPA: hypothetical protein VFZ68_08755 [Acidimicrobiales bacterium]
MNSPRRVRRLAVMVALAGAMSGLVGVPPAASQEAPERTPTPDVPALVCDPETGELVMEGAIANPVDAEMTLTNVVVVLVLDPGTEVEEEIDLSHLFPETLAPLESVPIGRLTFPGDRPWGMRFAIETMVEGFEEPGSVVGVDILLGPCEQPAEPRAEPPPVEEPAEPIEETPRFTG